MIRAQLSGGVLAKACAMILMLCAVACQPKENPVLSNEQFAGEAYPSNALLSQAQRNEVVAALRATAIGMPTDPLTKAPDAVRWSDVKAAAKAAIVAAEMGVVKSTLDGTTWTFEIETQGGEPATLTVVQRDAPEMYLATATVGTFGERFESAERIVREFRMAMRRFGALKRPS